MSCNAAWIGDTMCDDSCNHPKLQFDGGDCCFSTVNSLACTDCFCYNTCSQHELDDPYIEIPPPPVWTIPDESFCSPEMIGNGICSGICNTEEFEFDGDDCCYDLVVQHFYNCGQTCECHQTNYVHIFIVCPFIEMLGDGHCDWECNIPQTDFDKGDCYQS